MRYSDRRLETFCEINIDLVVDFAESALNLASLAWGQQIGDTMDRTVTTTALDQVAARLEEMAKPFGEVVTLLLTVDRRDPKIEKMILGTTIIKDTRWERGRLADQDYIVWSLYAQEDGTGLVTNGRGSKGGYHLTWSEAVKTAKLTQP